MAYFPNSLVNIGNIYGNVDNTGRGDPEVLYGASFKPIKYNPGYYSTTIPYLAVSPWLGTPFEGTFLNATKRANEPPVKTYRELSLFPIPNNRYKKVQCREGFGGNQQSNVMIMFMIFIAVAVIVYFSINK